MTSTAARWSKMASNLDSHPKIRRAGRNGREVFLFALRKNMEPGNAVHGVLPEMLLEPWYVADQLMMPEADALDGVTRVLAAGLLAREGDSFRIVGWDDEEWGVPATGAERTKKWREKEKAKPSGDGGDEKPKRVTSGDERDVTQRHGVTSGDASDGCDTLEERRGEEQRGEERGRVSAGADAPQLAEVKAKSDAYVRDIVTGKERTPRGKKRKPGDLTPEQEVVVTAVLQKLGKHSGVTYQGATAHRKLIVSRLSEGLTEDDLRKVIAYCALELGWESDPKMRTYLRPETLFGPTTIAKYLDAARSWFEKLPEEPKAKPENAFEEAPFDEPTWLSGGGQA